MPKSTYTKKEPKNNATKMDEKRKTKNNNHIRKFCTVWHSLMEKSSEKCEGEYKNWSPYDAAPKAGNAILTKYNKEHHTNINIVYIVLLDKKKNKLRGYVVRRQKKTEPVDRDNYKFKFDTKAKKSDKAMQLYEKSKSK